MSLMLSWPPVTEVLYRIKATPFEQVSRAAAQKLPLRDPRRGSFPGESTGPKII